MYEVPLSDMQCLKLNLPDLRAWIRNNNIAEDEWEFTSQWDNKAGEAISKNGNILHFVRKEDAVAFVLIFGITK